MFMHPKKATLFTIIALTLIGLLSYTIKSSVTALIPVFFAVLMGICYFLYDNNNKLYAHIIMVLMLVVFAALFAILWFPIKRFFNKKKQNQENNIKDNLENKE